MTVGEFRAVGDVWGFEEGELGAIEDVRYVQIFENRGAMMGASNPHPHGQVWASRSVPNEVVAEQRGQAAYLAEHGGCLLCAYRELELGLGERVIAANAGFVAGGGGGRRRGGGLGGRSVRVRAGGGYGAMVVGGGGGHCAQAGDCGDLCRAAEPVVRGGEAGREQGGGLSGGGGLGDARCGARG